MGFRRYESRTKKRFIFLTLLCVQNLNLFGLGVLLSAKTNPTSVHSFERAQVSCSCEDHLMHMHLVIS